MRKVRLYTVGGLALAGLLAYGAPAIGQVWVSSEGKSHEVPAGAHMLVIDDEGGERFDLADLADGETRVFGEGEKQLTARRSGDEVVLSRPASGGESAMRITCRLSTDACSVVTIDGETPKTMVIVEKSRECHGDDADCEVDADVIGSLPHGAKVIVRRVECDGEDCQDVDETLEATAGAAVVHVETAGGRTVLRCPKGDTTMRVESDEASKTWLCPKHSLPLEKVTSATAGPIHVFRSTTAR